MTPTPATCTGYDSFWAAAEDARPAADPRDPADAYAAFVAVAEG